MSWAALKNDALLSEAEQSGFAVMLMADKGIKSQQRMEGRLSAVVILRAHNTKLKPHLLMIPEVLEILTTIQPGQLVEVFHPDMKP